LWPRASAKDRRIAYMNTEEYKLHVAYMYRSKKRVKKKNMNKITLTLFPLIPVALYIGAKTVQSF
jgi:hypothetical protein